MVLQPHRPNPLGPTSGGTPRPIWKDRELAIDILPMSVSGDGSDGNVTITGTTTLTRDMLYHNLTIDSGGILQPNGYAVHVRRVLTNNGTIRHNGNSTTISTGGAALSTNHFGGGAKGGNSSGNAGDSSNPGKGGNGGTGGDGSSDNGGAGGVVTAPTTAQGAFEVPPNNTKLHDKSGTEVLGGGGGASQFYSFSKATDSISTHTISNVQSFFLLGFWRPI